MKRQKPRIAQKTLFVVTQLGTQNGYGKSPKAAYDHWESLKQADSDRRQTKRKARTEYRKLEKGHKRLIETVEELSSENRRLLDTIDRSKRHFQKEISEMVNKVNAERARLAAAYEERFGVVR